MVLVVKNMSANARNTGDMGQSPGWERCPLEGDIATHSSIPLWRIPETEDLARLQSIGLQRLDSTEATWHA